MINQQKAVEEDNVIVTVVQGLLERQEDVVGDHLVVTVVQGLLERQEDVGGDHLVVTVVQSLLRLRRRRRRSRRRRRRRRITLPGMNSELLNLVNRKEKNYQSGLLLKLKVFTSHRNVQMSLFCIQPELSLQFFESP